MDPQDPAAPTGPGNAPPASASPATSPAAPRQTAFGTPASGEPEVPEIDRDNDLARLMKTGWESIQPKLPAIVGVLLLIGIAAAIAGYVRQAGSAANAEAWKAYDEANGVDGYREVAERYPTSTAAGPALVMAGRDLLNQGVRRSMSDRNRSVGDLNDARELFEDVLARDDLSNEMALQAQQGLAVAIESLSDGSEESIAEAKGAYERLAAMGSASGFPRYVGYAQARLKSLEQPATAELYAWLGDRKSSAPQRPEPKDGLTATPGQVMDDGVGDISQTVGGVAPERIEQPGKGDATQDQGNQRDMAERSIDAGAVTELYDPEQTDGTDGVSAAQNQDAEDTPKRQAGPANGQADAETTDEADDADAGDE